MLPIKLCAEKLFLFDHALFDDVFEDLLEFAVVYLAT